jgi:hypothetical protein
MMTHAHCPWRPAGGLLMARQGFYGFERRRKADQQKAKQEAKRLRRSEREESGVVGPEMGEAPDTGAPTGMWEWFSPSRTRTITTPPKTRPEPGEPNDWMLLTDVPPEDVPPA